MTLPPSPQNKQRKDTGPVARIVNDVIRGLYEGRFVPGQRLVEPDLVAQYGLSRGAVRDALKQLAADGIVVAHPYRGAQIRSLTRTEAANIFAVTEVILGLAARQAAQKIDTPGARDKISHHFEAISQHADASDHFAFIRLRNQFFRTLIDVSGNDELRKMLPRLQVHLIRNRLSVPTVERVAGYRAITDAILKGDAEQAETAARSYVAKTADCALPNFPQ